MDKLVIVRGGGDIATGTIHRLVRAGFKTLVLELPNPSAIRRRAAFCEAVFDGVAEVEQVVCRRAADLATAEAIMSGGEAALLIDSDGEVLAKRRPMILVDAILAKRNCGTKREQADFTIALGPGFTAGGDVDCVIETMRGHNLGRVIYEGQALPNTGVPGEIKGYAAERVIHAPADGCISNRCDIADIVQQGQTIAVIGDTEVKATLTGVLRGIIRDGYMVSRGLKIADIDPRLKERDNCFTISDKARCISGGVLEAVMSFLNKC